MRYVRILEVIVALAWFIAFPFVSGAEISAPSAFHIEAETGSAACTTLAVHVDSGDAVTVTSAWAEQPSRILAAYKFFPRDLGLIVEHSPVVWLSGRVGEIPVCVAAMEPGTYYGVLLVKPSQSVGGVGSWMTVEIRGERKENREARVYGGPDVSFRADAILFANGVTSVTLFGFLIVLWHAYRKKLRRFTYS